MQIMMFLLAIQIGSNISSQRVCANVVSVLVCSIYSTQFQMAGWSGIWLTTHIFLHSGIEELTSTCELAGNTDDIAIGFIIGNYSGLDPRFGKEGCTRVVGIWSMKSEGIAPPPRS